MVTVSRSIVVRWSNHFSQLFSVHGVNDVRQTETHTAERLVPEPSAFEAEMAIGKLKRHISPGTDQIPAELFKVEGRTIHSEIHKLINSTRVIPKVMSNNFLHENWEQQTKESTVVDGTSCCVILECLVTSIACIT